ncbi:hypothetical protein M446_5244 [Methylobacterium sp. 4-46]|nr:hypothetical protein M446_5244 [Methylobacterium sp. 4-46]
MRNATAVAKVTAATAPAAASTSRKPPDEMMQERGHRHGEAADDEAEKVAQAVGPRRCRGEMERATMASLTTTFPSSAARTGTSPARSGRRGEGAEAEGHDAAGGEPDQRAVAQVRGGRDPGHGGGVDQQHEVVERVRDVDEEQDAPGAEAGLMAGLSDGGRSGRALGKGSRDASRIAPILARPARAIGPGAQPGHATPRVRGSLPGAASVKGGAGRWGSIAADRPNRSRATVVG